MTDRLFPLLPSLYRLRDRAEGDPLRALLSVLDVEVERLEAGITGMYDNWFIETCDEWVVPYIGDLLGVRPLVPLRDDAFSQRGYVANTLAYRRRKGTAAVLEALARDLTGWPARAVEFFERLATTQHVNHPRLDAPATASLRDAGRLEYVGTAFETVTHTADVRHVDSGRGRYNIPHVGLFLFRLQSQQLIDASPRAIDATRFTFNPLGTSAPLFTAPAPEADLADLAAPDQVPMPISRRALHDARARYYGTEDAVRSLRVSIDGVVQPVETIDACNLADAGSGWAHAAKPGRLAIDPTIGRIAFADPPAGDVSVSYAYGFAGDLGGGPYDRRVSLASLIGDVVTWQAGVARQPPAGEPRIVPTLAEAVTAWNAQPPGTQGLIVLMDSRTHEAALDTNATRIAVPAGSRLVITSALWPEEDTGDPLQPRARLTGRAVPVGVRAHVSGAIEIVGTAPADAAAPGELVLNGVLVEGVVSVRAGNLGALRIDHSTLAPGASSFACADNPRLRVSIARSIAGDLALGLHAPELVIADAIIDGAIDADALRVDRSTVFGATRSRTLDASENIFVGAVTTERRQTGCVRFSALPFASETPRRYRCQPDRAEHASRRPLFASTRYGDAAYATLALACPREIAQGAEDEGEMGAWNSLQAPMRLRNLRVALDEYLRFGLEAGTIIAPQRL